MSASTVLAVLGLASLPLVAQTVRVVDVLGGGDFVDLAAAVAASAPGDTIRVVHGGSFGRLLLAWPLQIVANGPAPTIAGIDAPATAGLSGGATVLVNLNTGALTFSGNASVVLENVTAAAVRATSVASLLLDRCTITGVGNPAPGTDWNLGLWLTNAAVVDCTITGGLGFCDSVHTTTFVVPPDPGIRATDSVVTVAGGTIAGGPGGPLPCGTAFGGPGIESQNSLVQLTRTVVRAGTGGGIAVNGIGSSLVADPSVSFYGTTFPPLQTRALASLHGAGVAGGSPSQLQLRGAPGSLAFVAVGDTAAPVTQTGFGLVWLDTNGTLFTAFAGVTDAAGQITWPYTMPALPALFPLYFEGGVLRPLAANFELTAPIAIAVR